jgi:hypothetical protein
MYCVENQVSVVLGARMHGFQDPKGPETELITHGLIAQTILILWAKI